MFLVTSTSKFGDRSVGYMHVSIRLVIVPVKISVDEYDEQHSQGTENPLPVPLQFETQHRHVPFDGCHGNN